MRTIPIAVSLVCVLLAGATSARQSGDYTPLQPSDSGGPAESCATSIVRSRQLGLLAATAVPSGHPLMFRQDPAILSPDFEGTIVFRDFIVVGDHETVQFSPNDPDNAPEAKETWRRTGTRTLGGELVSVFEPSWSSDVLGRLMTRTYHGFDRPFVYWGAFIIPGLSGEAAERYIYVKLAGRDLPAVRVTRIDDTVQFTSHVVNLVVPGFGDTTATGDVLGLAPVTSRFYSYFEDTYDSLAIVPEAHHIEDSNAFHANVRNEVRNIGERIFDRSSTFGSQRVLQSVEFYQQAHLTQNRTSSHEIGHQWGSYFDWNRLLDITAAGHDPSGHDPLWARDETYIGAVLTGTRRVRPNADGEWAIDRTPAPIRQHPLLLYAMGKLPKESVPEIVVFEDQGQFKPTSVDEPEPGTTLKGGRKSATIDTIVGAYGERSGPSPDVWRRGTIVVSRDRLLSQRELDYWTFFMQRLEDPQRTGMLSYEGYPSYDASTGHTVDLRTDIRPRSLPAIAQPLPVDFPPFGRSDWRGVIFDQPVPSRFRVGERVRVTGQVTSRDRTDFDQVMIRFWKHAGADGDAIRLSDRVRSNGGFIFDIDFREGQQGRYSMEVFLFWPGSGPQFPRSRLTPVIVE